MTPYFPHVVVLKLPPPGPPVSSLNQKQNFLKSWRKPSVNTTLNTNMNNPCKEFSAVNMYVKMKLLIIVLITPMIHVPPRINSNPNNPFVCLRIQSGLDSNSHTL